MGAHTTYHTGCLLLQQYLEMRFAWQNWRSGDMDAFWHLKIVSFSCCVGPLKPSYVCKGLLSPYTCLIIGPRYTWGPIYVSGCHWHTFLKLNWCDSGWWRYRYTNSIQTDSANRAIQCNVTMQVMQVIQPGEPTLEPMQVAPANDQAFNQCK